VAHFAASCDDPKTNEEFAKSLGLDYPILSDPEKTTAAAYGVLGLVGLPSRTTIYVDANGKVAFIDTSVRTSSHGKDVATKLAELGARRRP
jgi:peroxiredoxin Q/BCP